MCFGQEEVWECYRVDLSVVATVFSILNTISLVVNRELKVNGRFRGNFGLFKTVTLSVVKVVVLSPFVKDILGPFAGTVCACLRVRPSMVPTVLLTGSVNNTPLYSTLTRDDRVNEFGTLIITSVFNATVSFALPINLKVIEGRFRGSVLGNFLYNVMAVPIKYFMSKLVLKLGVNRLLLGLVPLVVFSIVVSLKLVCFPSVDIGVFGLFKGFVGVLVVAKLTLKVLGFLIKLRLVSKLTALRRKTEIYLGTDIIVANTFPLVCVVSGVLTGPFSCTKGEVKVGSASTVNFYSSITAGLAAFRVVREVSGGKMILGSTFTVSTSFALTNRLTFAVTCSDACIVPIVVNGLATKILTIPITVLVGGEAGAREVKWGRGGGHVCYYTLPYTFNRHFNARLWLSIDGGRDETNGSRQGFW